MRSGGRVRRERFPTLAEALDALAAEVGAAERAPARPAVELRVRRFEPGEIVATRVELQGPGAGRAGVDVRGDGSSLAWRGRLTKRPVEAEPGERPAQALRRALAPARP